MFMGMVMKCMMMLFISLSLGYALCVVAAKQNGALKTLGYTLGVSLMVLTFTAGLMATYTGQCCPHDKMHKMMKCHTK